MLFSLVQRRIAGRKFHARLVGRPLRSNARHWCFPASRASSFPLYQWELPDTMVHGMLYFRSVCTLHTKSICKEIFYYPKHFSGGNRVAVRALPLVARFLCFIDVRRCKAHRFDAPYWRTTLSHTHDYHEHHCNILLHNLFSCNGEAFILNR